MTPANMNDDGMPATAVEETCPPADFFISYTGVDREWAVWIAWWLEVAGYSVILQAWDFRPGHNVVLMMNRAAAADRTLAVLSPSFLEADFPQPEWAAAIRNDPTGMGRRLIPIRIKHCQPQGMLGSVVYLDLFGIHDEREAVLRLLDGVCAGRARSDMKPTFPGGRAPSPLAADSQARLVPK